MKNRHKINLLSCFLIMTLMGTNKAQQQPLYSQFTFNKILFNPATAGSEHSTKLQLAAYEQWVGFKGAPKFHTASFDTRVFEESRKPRRNIRKKFKLFRPGTIGVGANFFNEKYGTLSNTGFSATYSYHVKMDDKQLSFGFSPVLSNMGLKATDIVLATTEFDEAVEGDNTKRWILDFNFGVFFYAHEYFAGYSTHHISKSALQWGGSANTDYDIGRQHYLMGGYRYKLNSMLTIEPAMMMKIAEAHPKKSQLDISIKTTIAQDYWCGLSFKTSKTLSVFGGIQLDRYFFSYGFDYNMSEIRKVNYGSHEILLAVLLGDTSRRYRWLNDY